MAETAALLDEPLLQWVLPYALRFLFASQLAIMGRVLPNVQCVIGTHLINKAGVSRRAPARSR
jgi:hypothetical protein